MAKRQEQTQIKTRGSARFYKGFRGGQTVVITVGDSFRSLGVVHNLQTAEIVQNDIVIRSDGLLIKHVLHERPVSFPVYVVERQSYKSGANAELQLS